MSAVITPTYSGTFKLADRLNYADIFNGTYGGAKKAVELTCTYVIKCEPSGHVYVGATKSFYKRWKTHMNALRRGDHSNDQLQALFNKHGIDAFTISIVQHVECTDGLKDLEEQAAEGFSADDVLNYRVGFRVKEGWYPFASKENFRKPTRTKRGPQSVQRWFDYTSSKRVREARHA